MPRTLAEKLVDGALDGLISDNVVEVVRCKDCIEYKYCKPFHYCSMMGCVVKENDFCSFGERKDGEEE